jgi:hypothetical protein
MPIGIGMNWSVLFLAATPLAWLLPNHYFPWGSAWHEAVALLCVTLALLTARVDTRLPVVWAVMFFLGLGSVSLQWLGGHLFFAGDALMVAVYLLALAAAIAVGSTAKAREAVPSGFDSLPRAPGATIDAYALGLLLAAVASVAIALIQWTGAVSLGIWQVDMPPGGRPFGNVAQPNHLCTIAALGIVAAGLLRQAGRIGTAGFWVAALWMVFGMVATSSRTGWLQIAALAGMGLAYAARAGMSLRRREAGIILGVFAVGVAVWPVLNGLLDVQEGRPLEQFAQPGTRWLHWGALADAVTREPLWGYGWQQVSVAQLRVAELHPFVGEHIEHSHNLVFDLVIWAGLPVGLTMAGLAAFWLATRLRACRDGVTAWLLTGIVMLAVHAMLEYPLSYAYFLVPLGVLVGAVDAQMGRTRDLRVGLPIQRIVAAVLLVMLGWIGFDYLKAEQGYRLLRLESARFGTTGLTTSPPDLQLLTQLEAFQRFAHTEARTGMSEAELDAMRKVTERYAYPSSMLRYALAQGLNGQSAGASLTLLRLCRIHPSVRCAEGREAWIALRQRHAVLRDVPFPSEAEAYGLR